MIDSFWLIARWWHLFLPVKGHSLTNMRHWMLCRNWHPPRFVYHCHAVLDCGHFKCRATESPVLFSLYVVISAWRLKECVLILACVVHFKVRVRKGIDWQLMCGGVDWSLERQVDQCVVPSGCSSCGSVLFIVSPHRSPRVSVAEGSKYILSEIRIRNYLTQEPLYFHCVWMSIVCISVHLLHV